LLFGKYDLEANIDLSELRNKLMERVNKVLVKGNQFKNSFNKYAYLWVDDRKKFMKEFLQANKDLAPIQTETADGEIVLAPNLQVFKDQVRKEQFKLKKKKFC
jgi:dynein heavy chain